MNFLEIATGESLDEIGAMYGIKRTYDYPFVPWEGDEAYRDRIISHIKDPDAYSPLEMPPGLERQESVTHSGHEIVENYAGGKAFKYCRNCKTEVI
jgi:hypothetical protein